MIKQTLKKYSDLSAPIKATVWFTICNFVLKGISFITVPIFAALMPTEEYGIVSIYSSYEQIFIILATLELALGAYQRGILKYKAHLKEYTQSLQALWSIITLALFLLTFYFKQIFIELTETNTTVLVLMFIYILFQPAYNCWLNRKRFEYDYKPVVIVTIMFTSVTTIGALLALLFIKRTALVRIIAMLLFEILFLMPFYISNINIIDLFKNRKTIIEYWTFSLKFQLPLVLHSLSYLILAQSDKVLIGELVGKSEAAIYSIAHNLAFALILFQSSLNQVFKPWRYQKLENKEYNDIRKTTNISLVFIGGLVIAFIFIAPEIMKLLFRQDYENAIWIIPPLSVSVYFMYLYSIFTDIESYFYKTRYIMYASIISATTNILLNLIGIYFWGYLSCGYATLISYALFAILHYYFMKKVCRQVGIKKTIFNGTILILVSISILLLMVFSLLLYPFWMIRYLILFFIILLGIKKKNLIKKVLMTQIKH